MPKIVITGSKGYVGSRLLKKLPGAMEVDGSLISANLPDADIVYHLAAWASVPESWNRPVDYMENLRTTVRLAHAYPNAKIIYANTCASEHPNASPYAFSKRAGADYLKGFHKNTVSLVFPNIYGDSPRSFVDMCKRLETIRINGDGLQIRDYVHVDDIVEALVKAQDWPTGEYSLGSGIGTTVLDLVKATGKPYTHGPAVPEQREAVTPNTAIDWEPTVNVLEYVAS